MTDCLEHRCNLPVSVRALLNRQPMFSATTMEAAPADVQTVKLYRSLLSKM